jgi:hypothetical protein
MSSLPGGLRHLPELKLDRSPRRRRRMDMVGQSDNRQTHWQNVYRTRSVDAFSWYRSHLEVSLELLTEAGMSANSRVIDVGGGASTLVDDLLDRGLRDVSVLDVSE